MINKLLIIIPYWSNILSVIPKYLPLTLEAINIVKIKRSGGWVGGWWKVATYFNVSSRQGSFKAFCLMGHPLPILADPCLTLAGPSFANPCRSLPDPCLSFTILNQDWRVAAKFTDEMKIVPVNFPSSNTALLIKYFISQA